MSDFNPQSISDDSVLLDQVVISHSTFAKTFEQWLMAVLQANYGKTDEAIVKKVAESCRSLLAANIAFHEEAARLTLHNEPVIARQHRLLAQIYQSLASTKE